MNKLQKAILAVAWIAILTVNIPYVIPYYSKGFQHEVDTNTAAVYVPYRDSTTVTVPVINATNSFSETGQRVTVWLRNDYRDDEIRFAPRLTFALMFGFGILFSIVTRITTKPSMPTPP